MQYKPRTELTMEEATNSLTRADLRRVRETFNVDLINDISDDTKVAECLWALVWVFECRSNPNFTMDQLDAYDIGTVQNYFTPVEATDGSSELGKDSTTNPTPEPNGAS